MTRRELCSQQASTSWSRPCRALSPAPPSRRAAATLPLCRAAAVPHHSSAPLQARAPSAAPSVTSHRRNPAPLLHVTSLHTGAPSFSAALPQPTSPALRREEMPLHILSPQEEFVYSVGNVYSRDGSKWRGKNALALKCWIQSNNT